MQDSTYIPALNKVDLMNTIEFGSWPQNGTEPEPIEWIVLEETKDEILLLCKYCIATKGFMFDVYDESREYRTRLWEYSDLRHWLHETFYIEAFNNYQKDFILTTEIQTMRNDTESLDVFENKVFLLSKEQVELYLTTPELRKGVRTVNAANDPKVLNSEKGRLDNIPWWILPHIERGCCRSVFGKDKNKTFSYNAYPQIVFDEGTQYHGRNFAHTDWSVRPAIRLRKVAEVSSERTSQMYEESVLAKKIQRQIGDITKFTGDCVVNATNTSLFGSGGVDGAIHKAAGPALLAACKKLGVCKIGEAKITPGFGLQAKYIIHTVGPAYPHNASYENIQLCEKQLRSCYINALNLAREYNIESIAFPAISTGVYGYPKKDAALVALDTVEEWLRCHTGKMNVSFYSYDDKMLQIYEWAAKIQQKRYEYRRLPSLNKIYKLDHVTHKAYTLNVENVWEVTINGVYQDFAHGHIGSEMVCFIDIYKMKR